MPDNPDLLPCPFCGEMPNASADIYASVACINDNCLMDWVGSVDKTGNVAAAIAAWNTRADRWIPVSERLPEFPDENKFDRSVLGTVELQGKRRVTEIFFTHDGFFESSFYTFTAPEWADGNLRLIAWQYMPLPELPEEVEG